MGLTPLDLVIFFGALVAAMAVGFYAGRKEETSEDYFLAGRSIPWFGVAGSIFGSNVSANHIVGMMGIGFSVGFAQSHFELGAIAGLLMLCYGFLPVYRKLNLYTLSEYLGARYDERSRVAYAIIMILIMAVVQMVPGLYIGARSICVMVGGDAMLPAEVSAIGDAGNNGADGNNTDGDTTGPAAVRTRVNMKYYVGFVIALSVIAASYTILGGLKAVVWTDVIQSVLLLFAGMGVALLTFYKLGGWGEMMQLDAEAAQRKMQLYLPMNHPELPWTGVLTGLMAMHCFYWGTNQFIVQRALGARSDREARIGIVAAGFLKLLIPFFAVAGGIAAFYLFRREMPGKVIPPDTAFPELVNLVIKPVGGGIVGLVAAGLIGAILSSIDSMMNSAATIVTFDVYKRFINPQASEKQMIMVGRISIIFFVTVAAVMAIYVLDPNSKKNFFLQIVDYQNYLTPGILVAFLLGIFWKRGTARASIVTIVAGIFLSWLIVVGYDKFFGEPTLAANPRLYAAAVDQLPVDKLELTDWPEADRSLSDEQREAKMQDWQQQMHPVTRTLGPRLNFFHRVVGVILLSGLIYVLVSLTGPADPEKSKLTWTGLGNHDPRQLKTLVAAILLAIAVFASLASLMVFQNLPPYIAAWLAASWTFINFLIAVVMSPQSQRGPLAWLLDDRFWAGLLGAAAIFIMFYFY